ncbi:MAG: ferredoxin [Rhodobacteraceae bacterium]|nr:MAG: ferredoxin [Paracoccaceae bacterium]
MSALDPLAVQAAPHGLIVMGALHEDAQTLVLLGTGPGFWPVFTASTEHADGAPDPVDRWSTRVIGALAVQAGAARAVFPFGGPPHAPFLAWAKASGRAWSSPVGMLVHDRAGLMISYRGGLVFDGLLPLPEPARKPCDTCAAPCATACPVDALDAGRGYDVAACHAFLDTAAGQDCLTQGCRARRACPVSQAFGRDPAQSAFHMKAFHPS